MTERRKKSSKPGLLASLLGLADLRAEKNRLEAFLNAVPGEYCGWAIDGTVAFSRGFPALLGLETIRAITDIQNALSTSDAAVLEGAFIALQEEGRPFIADVVTADNGRTLRLSGKKGRDLEGQETFDILWLEDITTMRAGVEALEQAQEDIEAERDRLQAALDHLPMPLWLRDGQTNIVWCNRAYAQAAESSAATIIAEQKELSVKPARKGSTRQGGKLLAQRALDEGEVQEIKAHAIISGDRRLMLVTEMPLPSLHMTLGIARDITREEELETEQRRHVAANEELLEQLGTAIGIYDADQRLEFFNSAFSQLWDLDDNYLNSRPKLGDIMEKLRTTRYLPEQADFRKFKQGWLNMFTSLLQPHEDMLYLPNGRALRMLAVPHPLGGLMMTFEDVTSRLELESSYNTLIAVQKETLDNLNEGVVVFGQDGRLKLWNPAFASLWKLNPEDLDNEPHVSRLTERMKPFFPEKEWPQWQKKLVSQSIDRKLQDGLVTRADGHLIGYSTVPLPDGGVLVTHVDVTDEVKVENALREKNAALEAAEKLKLDFLANVSYQLRTPLNAITGFTEILDNEYFGPLNTRQKEYTAGMQDAGERLMRLIDDILDLSTIEAGYMELIRDNVEVKDILESVAGVTTDWARKEKVELVIKCPKTVGGINGDERRLKQAVLNLVRNAIAFSPEGGKITLSAKKEDGIVTIAVSDSGPGIPDADQKRIFEPFERSDSTAGMGKRGAGLGLSLVKNIVELHGGRIALESMEGKGATFTISIPAEQAQAGSDRKRA